MNAAPGAASLGPRPVRAADAPALPLSEVLDTSEVRLLLEDFRKLTGFGVALLDTEGRTVASSAPADLCRRHATAESTDGTPAPEAAPPCESAKSCPLGPHRCRHGLRNVEAAVTVLGRRLGTLFIGPFLFDDDPPAIALLNGPPGATDPSLAEGFARIPRFRRDGVDAASDFLSRLAGMLSTLSHGRVALSRTVAERDRLVAELTAREAEIRRLCAGLEARVAERTAELRARNDELQAFAYTIAHDLTAPLRGISGHTGALLEDAGESLDANARRRLSRISEAAHRGGRLIDALLRISALSRAVVVRGPVDLGVVAASIAEDLAEEEPDRSVTWVLGTDLETRADELLVRELLENLLRNSWKFTSGKPSARIEVGATRANGETIFHVRDDGAGFDMAHASSLFGAFHRAHPPGSFPGLGIGLAIAERIVRSHGGGIRATGSPGEGATFTFTLEPPPDGSPAGSEDEAAD